MTQINTQADDLVITARSKKAMAEFYKPGKKTQMN
jgi:hypothetical protein